MMSNTLCWRCKNAVPSQNCGCSWSKEFKPVEGWTAERKNLNISHGKAIESYAVIKCPKFEKG